MKISGYFHDLGKLVVPPQVLNKPDQLNNKEWKIMKTHSYYTHYALTTTKKLNIIKEWASYHHEKLDGQGYPFHLQQEE